MILDRFCERVVPTERGCAMGALPSTVFDAYAGGGTRRSLPFHSKKVVAGCAFAPAALNDGLTQADRGGHPQENVGHHGPGHQGSEEGTAWSVWKWFGGEERRKAHRHQLVDHPTLSKLRSLGRHEIEHVPNQCIHAVEADFATIPGREVAGNLYASLVNHREGVGRLWSCRRFHHRSGYRFRLEPRGGQQEQPEAGKRNNSY